MRVYTQDWDYIISASSLPYGCLNKPNTPSNPSAVYLEVGGALTRGINGLEYTFHADNYDGCYALKFTVDLINAGYPGLRALFAQYASLERCPAIQVNWDAYCVLGWTLYSDNTMYSSATDSAATGDFNGQIVAEVGTYTALMVKRQRSPGSGSEVAFVLTSPGGTQYKTNWFLSGDPYNRNQLIADSDGSIPSDYLSSTRAIFGQIQVADQLSYAEAEAIWREGNFTGTQERVRVVPDSSSNPTVGAWEAPVEMSVVGAQSDGWVVRYTTDGTDPRSSSTPAGFDLPTDLTYGSEKYANAVVLGSVSFTTRYDANDVMQPAIYMASLYTNVVSKKFLAPAGVNGQVALVAHAADVYAVYSSGGLYKLPINSPGSEIQVGPSHLIATIDETKASYMNQLLSSGSGDIVYAITIGVNETQVLHTLNVVTGVLTMVSDVYMRKIAKVGSTYYAATGKIEEINVSTGTVISTYFDQAEFNYMWWNLSSAGSTLVGSNSNGIFKIEGTGATPIVDDLAVPFLTQVDSTNVLAITNGDNQLLLVSTNYGTAQTGQVYTAPVTIGAPLVIGSSVVAKFAAFNTDYPNTTPERGPIVYRAYDFAIVAPVLASVATGARYYNDVPLIWLQPPSDVAGTSIYYTTDGTDPQTSPTRVLWAPGHVFSYLLNCSELNLEFVQSTLKAKMYHAASNTYSDLYEQLILFGVAPVTVTPGTGSFTNSFTMTWSCPTPGAQVVFGGLESLGITGPQPANGSLLIEMSDAPLNISFQSHISVPGLYVEYGSKLYGAYAFRTYWFYLAAPILSFTSKLSGVAVPVSAASPSAGAAVRYTLDGAAPTASSTLYTAPVLVEPGQVFQAVSVYNDVLSAVAVAEVIPEYQVREIATSSDGSNHHYYSMQQQIELTSTLGPSARSIETFSATGSTKVQVNDGATLLAELAMWNAAGITSLNTFASETASISFQPGERTHFWARFGVSLSTATFTVNANNWIDALAGNETTVDLVLVSAFGRAVFSFSVASDNAVSVAVNARVEGVTASSVVALGTLIADSSPTLTITISSGTISVTLHGQTASTSAGSNSPYWQQEFIVNAAQLNTAVSSVTLLTHVSTSSNTATLLVAPATPYCAAKSSATVARTFDIDFKQRESTDYISVTSHVSSYERPADASFSDDAKAYVINSSRFDAALPGVIAAGAFDAQVEFDFKIDPSIVGAYSSWINQVSGDSSYFRKPEIKLSLVAPGAAKMANSSTLADIAIQFDWSQQHGRHVMRLRAATSSSGTTYSELPVSYNEQRAVLRIRTAAGDPSSLVMSAVVNGAAIDVATVARPNGNFDIRFRRTFVGPRLSKSTTTLRRYQLQANCVETSASSIVLPGANFMLRGEPTGFVDSVLPVVNGAQAVYFNPATRAISVEARGFEPSDGRLLVGIFEVRNGQIYWSNTMYSQLIRFRTEVGATLTGGSVIGVGSGLKIEDGVVKWLESGFERSAPVGDAAWQSPNTYLDVLANKYVVRARERQRLNVTIARQA